MLTGFAKFFHSKGSIYTVLFIIAVAIAGTVRWWVAPLSAGPDVTQFWAFAQAFHIHGLDFYRYAEATADMFPQKMWGYVYPPTWVLILGICLCAVPGSTASISAVDTTWRIAMKTPIITADLGIGCLIFWAVPGSRAKKLVFAVLWLFHPTSWYQSAVFGQFDALAAVFIVASLITLEKRKEWLTYLLAGLAITLKQHTAIMIAGMMAATLYMYRSTQTIKHSLILVAPIVVLSIPFLVTGNLMPYAKSVFLPAYEAGYQYPIDHALSGTGSLLTYLHDVYGWETINLLRATPYVTGVMLAAVIILCYLRRVNPIQGTLACFLVFITLFYRVNYQYTVIFIPVALLVAAMTVHRGERILAIIIALFPALWIWLFDVSLWFVYLEPINPWVAPYLANIGMGENCPTGSFVIFSVTLAYLSLAYVVLILIKWNGWESEAETTGENEPPGT
jgi:hypothetical protein